MDFLASIRQDSDRFYATAGAIDPTLPVPSCPDWSIADLVWHLGEVHWFWGTDVEMRATDPEQIEKDKPERPSGYGDLVAWGRAQADRLIDILASTPGDVPVWTWALNETEHTVHFILRHQVQEAAVHRWDIQNAAAPGAAEAIEPEVASDSIDEILAVTLPWSVRSDKRLPGSVHLHCTDTDGEWFIHPDGRVEPIHAKGDVAIRGAASDLLLALYTRIGLDAVELIGDSTLAHELVARISTD